MISQINTASICSMEVQLIRTEVLVMNGLPEVAVVGDVDSSVRESVKRVMNALKNSGVKLPGKKVTVNFFPTNVKKSGSHMDLAIAVAFMVAYAFVDKEKIGDDIYIGELGLSGRVHFVKGILPILLTARDRGIKRCFVPYENMKEAFLVENVEIIPISSLQELVRILQNNLRPRISVFKEEPIKGEENDDDFSQILGQPAVKRIAKIAAAGMHSLLMLGPCGTGKTMTANRILKVLPKLTYEESIENTKLYSLAGLLDKNQPLIIDRPMRTVSSNVSKKALEGDIKHQQFGDLTLANNGILFLDELTAFQGNILESIRQAEDTKRQEYRIDDKTLVFPAKFMLVACMNTCKCGAFPDKSRCTCSIGEIKRFTARLSQGFLDRIDICAMFSPVEYEAIDGKSRSNDNETTHSIREQIHTAYNIQRERYRGTPFITNRDLTPEAIEKYCQLNEVQKRLLKRSYEEFNLSVRTYHSIMKVARTIADLAESERIETNHLIEAIGIRNIDRSFWKI